MAKIRQEQIELKTPTWREMASNALWALRRMWSTSRSLTITLITSIISSSLVPAGIAVVLGILINSLKNISSNTPPDQTALAIWLGLAGLLMLISGIANVLRNYCRQRLGDELQLKLSKQIYEHAVTLDLSFFEDPDGQDILARASQYPGRNFLQFVIDAINFVANIIQLISLLAIVAWIEPIALIVISIMIVPWLLFRWKIAKMRYDIHRSNTFKRRRGRYFGNLMTNRGMVATVKLLNLMVPLLDRFEQSMRLVMAADRRTYRTQAIGGIFAALAMTLGLIGMVGWVGYRTVEGSLELGMLVTFWVAFGRLRGSIRGTVTLFGDALENTLFVSNLHEFLDAKPTIVDTKALTSPINHGLVELQNVDFSYPGTDRKVIQNLNLVIEPGQTLAIVGPNGAGKTTLVKLVCRLYDVDAGRILIDGHDVRDLAIRHLHDHIAYLGQNPGRLEATFGENIAMGDWNRLLDNEEAIQKAIDELLIQDMVEQLPDGSDTLLGRMFGYYDLSGGQWRRLAAARTLVRSAPLLILDEATANLDPGAERRLFKLLERVASNRTTLIVTQRFSTARMADQIAVMENGAIVEQGDHDTLMNLDGLYTRLYDIHHGNSLGPINL